MSSKKELSETLGLSCVEKYFLAWLGRYYDVRKLYGNSFVSIGQVSNDFSRGATYENYCHIPRLQDIAEEYGVVRHSYRLCETSEALKKICAQTSDELCLIRVNTRFFLNFKRSSWREDHYVRVDKELNWLNEYPLSEGKFTEEEFGEIYDGAVCVYELSDLTAEPEDKTIEMIRRQSFPPPSINIGRFEDAIGILRMTRKRMEKNLNLPDSAREVLRGEIALLDRLYLFVSLREIKKKKGVRLSAETPEEELGQILEYEKRLWEAVK